jgi:GNAT superfamily N-acetyltransferase
MKSRVILDEITKELSKSFDYEFTGETEFEAPTISVLDRQSYIGTDWSIGLIVGPSGSGKSTLLKEFGSEEQVEWDADKAVCSHFRNAEDAQERLSAVGFNTIPAWMRPFHLLSNGEQFRANLARRLKDGAVIDEFTSVVDRNVAKSCSLATRRYIDQKGIKNVLFATCHYDIVEWLQPDWVFDTATGSVTARGSLQRPEISLEVLPCNVKAWELFRNHHYLSADINKSARCFLAVWNEVVVGFSAILAMPSGSIQKAWREHRTVILPDFQGMGLGVRLSDSIGEIMLAEGKRFFSKTAHPRLGEYRNASVKWRPTAHNQQDRQDYKKDHRLTSKYSRKLKDRHTDRLCYAHEYIGNLT